MIYPTKIEYEGKEYDIDTDFKTALECMQIVDDESISDTERSIAIVVMLFGEDIDVNDETLLLATLYLQCGKTNEEQSSGTHDMDFEQDETYIEASFMSDYHIDLSKEEMHWWRFCTLISGLTDNCILNQIRGIRNFDMNDLPDNKSKQKMRKAKEQVALKNKLSNQELEELDEFEKLLKGEGV